MHCSHQREPEIRTTIPQQQQQQQHQPNNNNNNNKTTTTITTKRRRRRRQSPTPAEVYFLSSICGQVLIRRRDCERHCSLHSSSVLGSGRHRTCTFSVSGQAPSPSICHMLTRLLVRHWLVLFDFLLGIFDTLLKQA